MQFVNIWKDSNKDSKTSPNISTFIRKLRRLSSDEAIITILKEFKQKIGTVYMVKMEENNIVLMQIQS